LTSFKLKIVLQLPINAYCCPQSPIQVPNYNGNSQNPDIGDSLFWKAITLIQNMLFTDKP